MCMEDIRIGRESPSGLVLATIGAASIQVLPADPLRTSIRFGSPSAGTITYNIESISAVGVGIFIPAAAPGFELNIRDHGDIVKRPWFARADAAARLISLVVTVLPRQ